MRAQDFPDGFFFGVKNETWVLHTGDAWVYFFLSINAWLEDHARCRRAAVKRDCDGRLSPRATRHHVGDAAWNDFTATR